MFIWLFVMRFKRVEVQVVQDEKETSSDIFRKLKCNTIYHLSFMTALLIFQIPFIVLFSIQDK